MWKASSVAVLLGGGAIPIAATEIKKGPTLADRLLASLSNSINLEHNLKLRNNIHLIGVRSVGILVPTSSSDRCLDRRVSDI